MIKLRSILNYYKCCISMTSWFVFICLPTPTKYGVAVHSSFCTLHSALCTLHSAFCILHSFYVLRSLCVHSLYIDNAFAVCYNICWCSLAKTRDCASKSVILTTHELKGGNSNVFFLKGC